MSRRWQSRVGASLGSYRASVLRALADPAGVTQARSITPLEATARDRWLTETPSISVFR